MSGELWVCSVYVGVYHVISDVYVGAYLASTLHR